MLFKTFFISSHIVFVRAVRHVINDQDCTLQLTVMSFNPTYNVTDKARVCEELVVFYSVKNEP